MSLAAINDTLSNWDNPTDATKTNELNQLWLAYDANNLYVGVKGTSEVLNGIACYLDVDYGSGTGATAIAQIDFTSGTVTNILITSAGSGYLSNDVLTVQLLGGGAISNATTLGAVSFGLNE